MYTGLIGIPQNSAKNVEELFFKTFGFDYFHEGKMNETWNTIVNSYQAFRALQNTKRNAGEMQKNYVQALVLLLLLALLLLLHNIWCTVKI